MILMDMFDILFKKTIKAFSLEVDAIPNIFMWVVKPFSGLILENKLKGV